MLQKNFTSRICNTSASFLVLFPCTIPVQHRIFGQHFFRKSFCFILFAFVYKSSHVSYPGATTDNLPAGVLYQVKASYKYAQEDTDELSFEVGEVINVVQYEDPEDQEEGWLMGHKEGTGEKGMFPANFTRPI